MLLVGVDYRLSVDIGEHLRTIWRRKRQVVGAALVIAAFVYLFTGSAAKVYVSDAVLRG